MVCSKACRKIIINIKKELLKSQDSKLRQSSIENVAETLLEQIPVVIGQSEKNKMASPGKVSVNNEYYYVFFCNIDNFIKWMYCMLFVIKHCLFKKKKKYLCKKLMNYNFFSNSHVWNILHKKADRHLCLYVGYCVTKYVIKSSDINGDEFKALDNQLQISVYNFISAVSVCQ